MKRAIEIGMGWVLSGVLAAAAGVSPVSRNLAYRRSVLQSSAADFNRTGHLITDGIVTLHDTGSAVFLSQYDSESPTGEDCAKAFDGKAGSKWLVFHATSWLQVQLPDAKMRPVKKYVITSANDAPARDPKSWTLQGSMDGKSFTDLDRQKDQRFPNRFQVRTFNVPAAAAEKAYRYYRLNVTENSGDDGSEGHTKPRVQLAEFDLLDETGTTLVRPKTRDEIFSSEWCSRGAADEWVMVDLGAPSTVRQLHLIWKDAGFASAYDVELSTDAKTWNRVVRETNGNGGHDTWHFRPVTARYVRLLCRKTAAPQFRLSELEVYGENDLTYALDPMPPPEADGTQRLTGGNWRISRAAEVQATGEWLSSPYDDSAWLPAVVPGTALTSWFRAGAIPDMNVADRQLMISDSYFTTDYWYRNRFRLSPDQRGRRVWLNFAAINWKADIYLNGQALGTIEGAFQRGRFDITALADFDAENILAVHIRGNDTPGAVTVQNQDNPGANGGVLGADNPTIHASIGWDWVPTIRGRNVGIYGDVTIAYTDDVTISDAWAVTDLDVKTRDFSKASVTIRAKLTNAGKQIVQGTLQGTLLPGGLEMGYAAVTLKPGETREVTLPVYTLKHPKLWWPNTYGAQPLYTAELKAFAGGSKPTDTRTFRFGVRKFTYDTEKPMTIYCNGTRIVCRGGNWGMDDANLTATPEDYMKKVRLHAEANLTMIRNWVGMTNHEAFYDACDQYGVLIWDDFWLANPADGPDPNDQKMFLANAQDKVLRNRHHAALALYCGRNEGDPPKGLMEALPKLVAALDGTRHYIPHSASGTVSGFGPYGVRDPKWYFGNTPDTLHSERGLPNIPAYESLIAMLTPEHAWPIDDVWGMHDFTKNGAQSGGAFLDYMNRHYAAPKDLASFATTAQWVNYENHKALFEAMYTGRRNGILMWMSQSAWPSMVWQTYDYYYDTNAGYFGAKKANQPINVILDPRDATLWLSNATPDERKDLTFTVTVFDLHGKRIHQASVKETLQPDSRKAWEKIPMKKGATPIQFVRATVTDSSGKEIADNFTWMNRESYLDYRVLAHIADATVSIRRSRLTREGGQMRGTLRVANTSDVPALMVRIKAAKPDGERILPVYYSDNYIALMPGETREITFDFAEKDAGGQKPVFTVEGWNVK